MADDNKAPGLPADFPGMPPGMGAFDFSSIQNVLNVRSPDDVVARYLVVLRCCSAELCPWLALAVTQAFDVSSVFPQDPSIMQMAQQISQDPSFQEMTKTLQESMQGLMSGAAAAEPEAAAEVAGPPDPSKYFEAMNGMLSNPQFMQMAEKLGQEIMKVTPCVCPHCC